MIDIAISNELTEWSSKKAHILITNCLHDISICSSDIETINLSDYELINNTFSSIPSAVNEISQNLNYDKFNQYSIKNEGSIFQIKEVDEEDKINEDISPISFNEPCNLIKLDQKLYLNILNKNTLIHSITLETQNSISIPNETYISVDDPRNHLPTQDLVF